MNKRSLLDIIAQSAPQTLLASVLALPTRSYDVPKVPMRPLPVEQVSPEALFRSVIAEAIAPSSTFSASRVFIPEPIAVAQVLQAVSYSLPQSTGLTVAYSPSTPVRYEPRSENYVHVPSWVTVSRAPFSQFGASLFGLSVPSTGSVYVRDDLQGNEFTEVLFHEVLHTLYPSCSESDVRSMVLARFGSDAPIHTHVCRPGFC